LHIFLWARISKPRHPLPRRLSQLPQIKLGLRESRALLVLSWVLPIVRIELRAILPLLVPCRQFHVNRLILVTHWPILVDHKPLIVHIQGPLMTDTTSVHHISCSFLILEAVQVSLFTIHRCMILLGKGLEVMNESCGVLARLYHTHSNQTYYYRYAALLNNNKLMSTVTWFTPRRPCHKQGWRRSATLTQCGVS